MKTIDELKEIASEVTREEFLDKNTRFSGYCVNSFNITSLKNVCEVETDDDAKQKCTGCWNIALIQNDIKFKDDVEKDDIDKAIEQPNTYTITDILNNFPTETKFLSNDHLFKIQLGELQTYDEDTQEWRKSINSLKQILDMKFTKVEEPKLKPMTFEEAVRTGNKIKYESEIQRNFEPVNKIIEIITKYSPSWIVKEIFLGTWYAEGMYE